MVSFYTKPQKLNYSNTLELTDNLKENPNFTKMFCIKKHTHTELVIFLIGEINSALLLVTDKIHVQRCMLLT